MGERGFSSAIVTWRWVVAFTPWPLHFLWKALISNGLEIVGRRVCLETEEETNLLPLQVIEPLPCSSKPAAVPTELYRPHILCYCPARRHQKS
jgi:hypothetical protein